MKIRVSPGYTNPNTQQVGKPRLKFLNITPLSDVLEQNVKKVSFFLETNSVNQEKINFFKQILDSEKGNKNVEFIFYKKEDNNKITEVQMNNLKHKIRIDKEDDSVLDKLTQEGISFKLG